MFKKEEGDGEEGEREGEERKGRCQTSLSHYGLEKIKFQLMRNILNQKSQDVYYSFYQSKRIKKITLSSSVTNISWL